MIATHQPPLESPEPSSSSATAWSASASASGWSSSTPSGGIRIVTFCEEPRAAYDRVGLTSFFAHRDAEKLMLARQEWYAENGVELHIGDRANAIDRKKRIVRSDKGVEIAYDYVVLATGSYPVRAAGAGHQQAGRVRLPHDRRPGADHRLRRHSRKRCAVIGGGLLGLEAAKAAYDLGLETHVVEFAPRLMPRQVDDAGSRMLVSKIESLGVRVHLNKSTKAIHGNGRRRADGVHRRRRRSTST